MNLSSKQKIIQLKQTCFACPEQYEGKLDNGQKIYVRERHGSMRIDIDGKTVFSKDMEYQDDVLGIISSLYEIACEIEF